MKRAGFLYNGPDPSTALSNEFTVEEGVVRVTAKVAEGFYIQTSLGAGGEQDWVDLYRYGTRVELTPSNVQHIELIPGRYRVVPLEEADTTEDIVYFEEDEFLSNDRNRAMMFVQAFV